ncbi:MAG: helix-turn-helix transcriptional regulator [Kiritimatiellia bacterium]
MQTRRKHLRLRRREKFWTALDEAEAVGISEDQVYFIERGRTKPTREVALRIASALELPPEVAFPEVFAETAQ